MTENRKKKISALLVVHNEEKLIKKCLDSIKDVVDEIIIIHDGPCKDRTLEIAKNYGITEIYISSKKIGNAEPHRPFAAQMAKGEWLLPIDADEYLSDKLKTKILEIKMSDGVIENMKYDRIIARWSLYRNKTKVYDSHKVILIRKSKTRFIGIPHHKWELKEGKSIKINEALIHNPPISRLSFFGYLKKCYNWSKIHAKYSITFVKNPKLIPKFNYSIEDYPKKSIFRIKHPLLTLIPVVISTIILTYKNYKIQSPLLKLRKIINQVIYQIMLSFWLYVFNSLWYRLYVKYVKKSEIFYNNPQEFKVEYKKIKAIQTTKNKNIPEN